MTTVNTLPPPKEENQDFIAACQDFGQAAENMAISQCRSKHNPDLYECIESTKDEEACRLKHSLTLDQCMYEQWYDKIDDVVQECEMSSGRGCQTRESFCQNKFGAQKEACIANAKADTDLLARCESNFQRSMDACSASESSYR